MSNQGILTQDVVEMIWKCQQGKHEETVRVVYGLINEVVGDLSQKQVEILYQKIASVPQAQYSEMYLNFLKEFS